MLKFTQLIENNDHEGESWCFWVQVDGNEVVIETLIQMIEDQGEEDSYEFTGVEATEEQVDTLVSLGNFGYGYMSQHHKIAGTIVLTDDFEIDNIYKGNLDEFVVDNG